MGRRCWRFVLFASARVSMLAGEARARRRVVGILVTVVSVLGCVGLASAEIGQRAAARDTSGFSVHRVGARDPETLALLRAAKKARSRQRAQAPKVSEAARMRSRR